MFAQFSCLCIIKSILFASNSCLVSQIQKRNEASLEKTRNPVNVCQFIEPRVAFVVSDEIWGITGTAFTKFMNKTKSNTRFINRGIPYFLIKFPPLNSFLPWIVSAAKNSLLKVWTSYKIHILVKIKILRQLFEFATIYKFKKE